MDEMLVTACGVIKATVLYKEPIRLHPSPPSTAHMRAYTEVKDGELSGTQSLTPDREEVPQQPPSNPHPDGRTQCQFQMDLGDAQLRQLIEDLCQEVTLRELNVPPRDPPLGHWGTPTGNRDPNVDDQEVTFLRGRGWEPRGQPLHPTAPPTKQRCRMSHKYLSHWIVTGYAMHKHLQWQSHTGEDRSVFGTVVPWGTMC